MYFILDLAGQHVFDGQVFNSLALAEAFLGMMLAADYGLRDQYVILGRDC